MDFRYKICYDDSAKGGLFDRWLIFHSDEIGNLTGSETIQKINEFTEKYTVFKIEMTISHELMRIVAKTDLKDDVIHRLTLKLDEG